MGLVTPKEIARALNLDSYGALGTAAGWSIMKVLRISRLNSIYDKHKHLQGVEFLDSLLDEFGIQFSIPENDLKRIPRDGAFITVSNHPLGGIDGILLLKLLLEARADYKIIANFLLHRIEPLKEYVMPVNPFEDRKDAASSIAGFKQAIGHIRNGAPLGIFPAGEVSTYKDDELVVDKAWEPAAMKLAQKAKVPIVPIYFHAKNSKAFYSLARVSDTLRTAKLPSELLSQKRRNIKVRIGNPISVKDQEEHKALDDYTEFLRTKTYLLSRTFSKENLFKSFPEKLKKVKEPKRISPETSGREHTAEIQHLKSKDALLLETKNYEVYLAQAADMPHLLREIGRLREITFRAIGEGTNKSLDLDQYDQYYHHLLLWDTQAQKLAGAYRMGLGSQIFAAHGIDGFYIQSLFSMQPELYPMMQQTIEMGRAFITQEYQQRALPLFLLWKGIVHTCFRFPEHRYLMGGVSISDKFSDFTKSLMIEFMKSNYYDPYMAQYITPKKEYKVKLKDADKDFIFDESKADLNKFDKLIEELEPGEMRIPVLLKKYIKQNAKLVAFNVDPLFNNAVDGLMYIRIDELPESTVGPVLEEINTQLEQTINPQGSNID